MSWHSSVMLRRCERMFVEVVALRRLLCGDRGAGIITGQRYPTRAVHGERHLKAGISSRTLTGSSSETLHGSSERATGTACEKPTNSAYNPAE